MTLTNKQIVAFLKEKFPEISAIYLTGSRLNHLAIRDTDYDVVAIVPSTLSRIISGQAYAKETHFPDDGLANEIQVKVYDTLKLCQLINKSNPNILELFYEKPLYVSMSFKDMATYLADPTTIRQLCQLNVPALLSATKGQYYQMSNLIKKKQANLSDKEAKYFVQMIKFHRYLKNVLDGRTIKSVDMSDLIPFKADFSRHYKEALVELDSIESTLSSLKPSALPILSEEQKSVLQLRFFEQAQVDVSQVLDLEEKPQLERY